MYYDLSQRYEGITKNRELARIALLPGFDTTRRQLAAWINSAQTEMAPDEDEPSDGPSLGDELSIDDVPDQPQPESVQQESQPDEKLSDEIELLPPPRPQG